MKEKQYIGDGVYVEDDGHCIILTTHNGEQETNSIYLEPDVWDNLLKYVTTNKPETK